MGNKNKFWRKVLENSREFCGVWGVGFGGGLWKVLVYIVINFGGGFR